MASRTATTPVTITGSAIRLRRAKATNVTTVATAAPVQTERSRVSNVPVKQSSATQARLRLWRAARHRAAATHAASAHT